MGINGLLPLLKSIQKPCTLKKFEGKTLGVDAYGWLHRGTVACAMDIALGKPTRKYVEYCMHRVRMLQHFGVTPYLIFDGDYLPSKAATEKDREKRRLESTRAGQELLRAGKMSQAYMEFQKAVDVTPDMARHVIDELKKVGVQYIVAPYEADAQMVYLERQGIIDGILSEDSDLLVFGAKCLLTKLDQYGNCIEINKADFCACKDVNLTGWSDTEFRTMAILSGCDYLASINNMGLKTAYRLVRKYKTVEKVIRMIQFDGKFHIPKGYLEAFYQAEFTFLHQRVFCPVSLTLVFHTPPEEPLGQDQSQFIGPYVEPEIAQGVAKGDLNPVTKQRIIVDRKDKTVSSFMAPKTQHRSLSTNDLKKGVSIGNYFKPQRRPLAELDVNCFTPSQSQQELLSRASGQWIADPVRPYLQRSTTQPEPELPLHSVSRAARPIGRRLNSLNEPRAPKRARLCEDDDLLQTPGTGQNVEVERSRFFASAPQHDSSSALEVSKQRKSRKKEDITIFSDDSIEEATLSLPDVSELPGKKPPKVSIYKDNNKLTSTVTASVDSRASHTSQATLSQSTAASSTCSITEQSPTSSVERSTSVLGDLKSRFSFGATTVSTPKSVANYSLPTPPSSAQYQSKIPIAVKSTPTTSAKSSIASNRTILTPLQRLGAAASGRFKMPPTPPLTPMLANGPIACLRQGSVPFPEVEVNTKKIEPVEPASIPLPSVDEIEKIALGMGKGSEDLIVPNSDDEYEPLSPIKESTGGALGLDLNLGRFSYVG
ncbi:Rad2 nuclease [Clarireedia jacksonii]